MLLTVLAATIALHTLVSSYLHFYPLSVRKQRTQYDGLATIGSPCIYLAFC